jgi:hypothetical protein
MLLCTIFKLFDIIVGKDWNGEGRGLISTKAKIWLMVKQMEMEFTSPVSKQDNKKRKINILTSFHCQSLSETTSYMTKETRCFSDHSMVASCHENRKFPSKTP